MNDTDRALAAFSVAAYKILHLQNELRRAEQKRNAALMDVHESGVPKCYVAAQARQYLTDHGFDERQIKRLAISPASVRLVLDGRRSPVPYTSSSPEPKSV
jgi:hypothetical protein